MSPAMYEEFIFPYEKPIMERFGLNCYGCCEPLHGRWHVVRQHPHLRRVSCSPWANVDKMADYLGDKYIFSLKPNPAALAVPAIDDGGHPPRAPRGTGKDPGLRRGNHHEGQPHLGPSAGERRQLVPHCQGRSREIASTNSRRSIIMKLGMDSYATRNSGTGPGWACSAWPPSWACRACSSSCRRFDSFRDDDLRQIRRSRGGERAVRGVRHGLDLALASHGGEGPAAAGRGRLRHVASPRPRSSSTILQVAQKLGSPILRCVAGNLFTRDEGHDMTRAGRPGGGDSPRGLPRPPKTWA